MNDKADWYVWADAKPDGTAPNNWLAIFGGPAWEWDTRRQQYYLHNFLAEQPDLNFHNPEVQDALLDVTARFWLERGVDGFRLDTVNYYFHDRKLRDNPPFPRGKTNDIPDTNPYGYQDHLYDKTQPENLIFLREFRALLNEYDGRAAVGEVGDGERSLKTVAAYTEGGDKLHMCYTFDLLGPEFSAAHVRKVVRLRSRGEGWLGLLGLLQPRREAPRDALCATGRRPGAGREIRADLARLPARLDLPLPGRGTRPGGSRHRLRGPARSLRHPLLARLQGPRRLPHADAVGSGPPERRLLDGETLAAGAARTTAPAPSTRRKPPDSVLAHYRAMLAFRKTQPALVDGSIRFIGDDPEVLAFVREAGNERLLCVFNFGREASPGSGRMQFANVAETLDLPLIDRDPVDRLIESGADHAAGARRGLREDWLTTAPAPSGRRSPERCGYVRAGRPWTPQGRQRRIVRC